jgi:acyl carrier protein
MTNKELYTQAFAEAFEADLDAVEQYAFQVSPGWDSIGHMSLVVALEDAFGVELEPAEIRGITSFAQGIEILRGKGVDI